MINPSLFILPLKKKKEKNPETYLAVQRLRLCASNAGATDLIPGQRTKIPHVAWHGQNTKIK